MLLEIPLMHRRLLTRDMWAWYSRDVAVPVAAVVGVVWLSRALMPRISSPPLTLLWIATTGALALVGASLVTPSTRTWLSQRARFS